MAFANMPDNVIACVGNHLDFRSKVLLAYSTPQTWNVLKPSVAPIITRTVDAARVVADAFFDLLEDSREIVRIVAGIEDVDNVLGLTVDVYNADGGQLESSGAQEYADAAMDPALLERYDGMLATRTQCQHMSGFVTATVRVRRRLQAPFDDYGVSGVWDAELHEAMYTVHRFDATDVPSPIFTMVWTQEVGSDDGRAEVILGDALDAGDIALVSVLFADHLHAQVHGMGACAPLRAPNAPYDLVRAHDIRGAFHPRYHRGDDGIGATSRDMLSVARSALSEARDC